MLLPNFMAMVSIIRQIYRQFLEYNCLVYMPKKLFPWFICLSVYLLSTDIVVAILLLALNTLHVCGRKR